MINVRFASEARFRWDKTAATREAQMTIPIRNKVEMGYLGGQRENGQNDNELASLSESTTAEQ